MGGWVFRPSHYRPYLGPSFDVTFTIGPELDNITRQVWLTEACTIVTYDSAHPTYLETICILTNVTQI